MDSKYVNTCYPAIIVMGQLIEALQSNKIQIIRLYWLDWGDVELQTTLDF